MPRKLIKNIFLPFLLASVILCSEVFSLEVEKTHFKGKFEVNYLMNRTAGNWIFVNDNLNKIYSYDKNNKSESDWDTFIEQKIILDTYYDFGINFNALLGLEIFGGYADTLYKPVNHNHRLYSQNTYFNLNKADIKYRTEFLNLRYFRSIGHYSWFLEGDLFEFYPLQFDIETYKNITGRHVPEAVELNIKLPLGDLVAVYGEPVWGYKDSLYLKYNYKQPFMNTHLLYRRENIPWKRTEDEYKESYAISSEFVSLPLEFGIIYQPFRLDEEYSYVEEVAKGTGDLGSKYKVKSAKTETKDTLGYRVRLFPRGYLLDLIDIDYSYLGVLAGNKMETSLFIGQEFINYFAIGFQLVYKEPIVNANPTLYNGTTSVPGPVYLSSRGVNETFRVDNSNRKATVIDLFLTYDPTPITSFYKYEEGNLESWNLDQGEDAGFSGAFRYNRSYYPTTTDRQWYYNEEGIVEWEPVGSAMWATSLPINFFEILLRFNLNHMTKIDLNLQTGQSLALGSIAYSEAELLNNRNPSISMLLADLKIEHGKYSFSLKYGKDVWGPYDWHKFFGMKMDKLYFANISRDIGKFGQIGLDLKAVRQDETLNATDDLGSFDEVKVSWSLPFNMFFNFSEAPLLEEVVAKKKEDKKKDTTPPSFTLKLSTNTLNFNEKGIEKLVINLNIDDFSGVKEWELIIENLLIGDVIFRDSGKGKAPRVFILEGLCINLEDLKESEYVVYVKATDTKNNEGISAPKSLFLKGSIPKVKTKKIKRKKVKKGKIKRKKVKKGKIPKEQKTNKSKKKIKKIKRKKVKRIKKAEQNKVESGSINE